MQARIAVIKKAFHKDVIDHYLPEMAGQAEICQVFVVAGPFPSNPDGFCDWAWIDIHKTVALTMMGANPPPGTEFSCCSDGLRPVIFKVERLPEKAIA